MKSTIKYPLFVLFLFLSVIALAQVPGGVGGNLRVWLRTDNGLVTTGTTVNQWQDNAGTGITGDFGVNQYGVSGFPTQTAPSTTQAGINFNTYVAFNGITNSLSSNTAFPAGQMLDPNNNTFFQVIRYKSGGVWLKWETDDGGTHRVGFESNGTRLRVDFPEAVAMIGINNVSTTTISNLHKLVTVTTDATNSVLRLNGANNATKNISAAGPFSDIGLSRRMTLGNNLSFNLPAQIDMAEIIFYNTKLLPADIDKVESYLAIKYGFTLDQTVARNYVNSSGAVVWDAAANGVYNADITGLGRDDNAALRQKQSRNNSLNDAVTMALGGIAVDNAANTGNFGSGDFSFLTWGHNGQTLVFGSTNVPQGLGTRLNRVWKAQASNFAQAVTLAFQSSMLPGTATAANVRLLVDDDGNFADAKVINGAISTSGRLEFSNFDFDGNTKFFFTLATCATTVPTLSYNNPVCPNATLLLQTSAPSYTIPSTSYSWTGPNTFTAAISSPTITPATTAATGSYTLLLSANTCTLPPATISVSLAPIPGASAGTSPTITCAVPTVTLQGSSPVAGVTYSWTGPGTYTSSVQNPTVSAIGDYTLLVTAASGCTNTAVVSVVINTVAPGGNAGGTQTITCLAPATLNGSSPVAGATYSWSGPGGFTDATATPTASVIGNYSLTVTDPVNGCTSSYTADVVANTSITVTATPPSGAMCPRDTVPVIANGAATYVWHPSGGVFGSGPNYNLSPNTTTTYTLVGELGTCHDSVYVPLTVYPEPVSQFTTDYVDETSFDGNLQTTDLSTGATIWQWSFGDGSPTLPLQQPAHYYDVTTPASYIITQTVTNPQGCKDESSLTIRVSPTTVLYVPNAFTPNGDGVNDDFGGVGMGITSYELWIYNRWGELLFHTNDISQRWNGTWKGQVAENGMYVYKILTQDIYLERKTYAGMLQLMARTTSN